MLLQDILIRAGGEGYNSLTEQVLGMYETGAVEFAHGVVSQAGCDQHGCCTGGRI